MELRRALLLFATVLILAALVSSLVQPPEDSEDEDDSANSTRTAPETGTATTPVAAPAPGSPEAEATTLRFPAEGRPHTRRLTQGRPATLVVHVDDPAQVDIPSLGLNQPAEPLTPARFDVLEPEPGSHPIDLLPVPPDGETVRAGTLQVVPASPPAAD